MCNNFKPERTHHCSTCNQCVLVMDHHCPWLNNCVGFNNRKVFILLITYTFLLPIFVVILDFYPIFLMVKDVASGNMAHIAVCIFACTGYVFIFAFIGLIWAFIKYHYDLIEKNKTTIEQLAEDRGDTNIWTYDMGSDFNWKFVLGANKWLWFIPIDWGIGAPMGDGVVISKKLKEGAAPEAQLEGEFDPNELEDHGKDWKDDEANDPLNRHGDMLKHQNPLTQRLEY